MVKATIEWKDGIIEERKFKGPDEYFRFVYTNNQRIKIVTSDADIHMEHTKVY